MLTSTCKKFALAFIISVLCAFGLNKALNSMAHLKESAIECRVIGKMVIPSGSKSVGYPKMAFRTVNHNYEFDTEVSVVTYSKYEVGAPIWMYIERGKLYPDAKKDFQAMLLRVLMLVSIMVSFLTFFAAVIFNYEFD